MRLALGCLVVLCVAVLPAHQVPLDSPIDSYEAIHQEAAKRTDKYGDPLPEGVVRRFGTLRLRDCGVMVFSPDGKYLVTTGGPASTEVIFWDCQTGKEFRRLAASETLTRLSFSPDGRLLAAFGNGGYFNPVWDVATGKEQFKFKGHQGCFTSDGKYLLGIYEFPGKSILRKWDIATGQQVREWTLDKTPLAEAENVCCSPDGKTLACTLSDRVILFDLENMAEKRRWACMGRTFLLFSSNGRHLAAADQKGIRVWEITGGKEEGVWDQRADDDVFFFADGKRLAWTAYDGETHTDSFWTAELGREKPRRLELTTAGRASRAAFSPDGKILAVTSAGGAVELRDLAKGKDVLPLDAHTDRVNRVILLPSGHHLATVDSTRLLIWEKTTGKLLWRFPDDLPAGEVVLTETLADGKVVTVHEAANAVRVRDLVTGKELVRLESPPGFVGKVLANAVVTADGKKAAILGWTGIYLFDLATGKNALAYTPKLAVWSMRFSADGQFLRVNLQGERESPVVVVDTRTGRVAESVPAGTHFMEWDGHWHFWPEALPRLEKMGLKNAAGEPAFAGFTGSVFDVLESHIGRYLAAVVGPRPPGVVDHETKDKIHVWDATTGEPLEHMHLSTNEPHSFSPDDRFLITTEAAIIKLWDLATGQERLQLKGHLSGVQAILITPDHHFLISGGDDSQVLLWDLTGRALDGVWRTQELQPQKRLALWERLMGTDDMAAHRAIWELAADPVGTVAFLATKLEPVPTPDDKEIARLIAELDSETFAKRQLAQARLTKIGDPVVPAMREVLSKPRSPEQRLRLQKLVKELVPLRLSGERLRAFRALEILERIGTPDSQLLLGKLAGGAAMARFTQTAREAMERVGKQ